MGNSKVEITKFYKMYNDVINRRTERRLVKGPDEIRGDIL